MGEDSRAAAPSNAQRETAPPKVNDRAARVKRRGELLPGVCRDSRPRLSFERKLEAFLSADYSLAAALASTTFAELLLAAAT